MTTPYVEVNAAPFGRAFNPEWVPTIDLNFHTARKIKKKLVYPLGTQAQGITLPEKKITLIQWRIDLLTQFAVLGASDGSIQNSAVRFSFGAYDTGTTVNQSMGLASVLFDALEEYDAYNFEDSTMKESLNESATIFNHTGTKLVEYTYARTLHARNTTAAANHLFMHSVSLSVLRHTKLAQDHLANNATPYSLPDSSIVFTRHWMRVFLRSCFYATQISTYGAGKFFAVTAEPDTVTGMQIIDIYGLFAGTKNLYRQDIFQFESAGVVGTYTISVQNVLTELYKLNTEDSSSSAVVTFELAGVQNLDIVPLDFPTRGTLQFEIRNLIDVASTPVFTAPDAEIIKTFANRLTIVEDGERDNLPTYAISVSFGVCYFNSFVFFPDIALHYSAYSLIDLVGFRKTYNVADGRGHAIPVDAVLSTSVVDDGITKVTTTITTAQGFVNSLYKMTPQGPVLDSSVVHQDVEALSGFSSSGDLGGTSFANNWSRNESTTVFTIPTSFADHLYTVNKTIFSGSETLGKGANEVSTSFVTSTANHPMGDTAINNNTCSVSYTMDGKTVIAIRLGGVYLADGIITDPSSLGTFDTPVGTELTDENVVEPVYVSQDNWNPLDGANLRKEQSIVTTTVRTAPGSDFGTTETVESSSNIGTARVVKEVLSNDNVPTRYVSELRSSPSIGGFNIQATGAALVEYRIELVDTEFRQLGLCRMYMNNVTASFVTALTDYITASVNVTGAALHDPAYAAYVQNGSIGVFEPELDESGDYIYALSAYYSTQKATMEAAKADLDTALATLVIENDFMSYELLHAVYRSFGLTTPLVSYVMIDNSVLNLPLAEAA